MTISHCEWAKEVGRKLGVQYVLEGSVRKAGTLPVPASSLIAEAGIEAQNVVGRAANGSCEQMRDALPKNLVLW